MRAEKYREWILYCAWGILVCGFIGYLFFKSITAAAILSLLGFSVPYVRTKLESKNRKNDMLYQFADFLTVFSSLLASGNSVPKAVEESIPFLQTMYGSVDNGEKPILTALVSMVNKMENRESPDRSFAELAQEWDIREMTYFSHSFSVMWRKGGNIAGLASDVAMIIAQKQEIENEIRVMTSEIRFSQRILSFMLPGMLVVMNLLVPDYMAPLYCGVGRLFMALLLFLVTVAWTVSERIMDIRY